MATREDLLATAEGLASAARQALEPRPTGIGDIHAGPSPQRAGELAMAAKIALEAAALAESLPVAEGDDAYIVALGAELETAMQAYACLRALCVGLERDFIAGDTDTSRRIAARIRVVLDDVGQLVGLPADTEGS